MFEVNKWNLELTGKRDAHLILVQITTIDAYAPELATRAFLFTQRGLKLILGEQALLQKYLSDSNFLSNFFGFSHGIK
jgi:hypothetical protein